MKPQNNLWPAGIIYENAGRNVQCLRYEGLMPQNNVRY